MVRIGITLLLTLNFFSLIAQDTAAIMSEIQNARKVLLSDPEEGLDMANGTFIKSRDLDFIPGIIESYCVVSRYHIMKSDMEKALKTANVALENAISIDSKKHISDAYYLMGDAHRIDCDLDLRLE